MKKELVRRVFEQKRVTPEGHQGTVNRVLIDLDSVGSKSLRLVHGTVYRGGGADHHSHDVESAFYILRGNAILHLGNKKSKVGPHTSIFIPAGVKHHLVCIGKKLEVLALYSTVKIRK